MYPVFDVLPFQLPSQDGEGMVPPQAEAGQLGNVYQEASTHFETQGSVDR
jgi:hypothetical protein